MSKKAKLPFRPHYIDDWDTSDAVRSMDMVCEGIYHRLLDYQWQHGNVPKTFKILRGFLPKLCLKHERAFEPFFDTLFPVCADGERRNPRCQKEREKALMISAKRAVSGSKGAESRHGQGMANASGAGVANASGEGLANSMANEKHIKDINNYSQETNILDVLTEVVVEGGSGGKPPPHLENGFFETCLATLNEVPGYARASGTKCHHLEQVWSESGKVPAEEFLSVCRRLRDDKLANKSLGKESTFAVSPCSDLRRALADRHRQPHRPQGASPAASVERTPDTPIPEDYEAI